MAAFALGGTPALSGCSPQSFARQEFSTQFNCPTDRVVAVEEEGHYVVSGCGFETAYRCYPTGGGTTCDQWDRNANKSQASAAAPAARPVQLSSEVRAKSSAEQPVLVLELVLDGNALLRVTAMPDKSDVVQLKLIRREQDQSADACSMDWMINGQILVTPAAVATRKNDVLSHRVQFQRDLIAELNGAEQIALRICNRRWALKRTQIAKVHDFVDRFQQELAWQGQSRVSPSSSGRPAPKGGWPPWSQLSSTLPGKVDGPALDARELFKKLSPSVFLLVAERQYGTSQGSAVAISTTELVTNCHVVEQALKLTLKQGKDEWPATISRADPSSDRCVVTTSALPLQPVAGMRSYDSLEVGEPAYTLGSPVGLELTLGNGIVSGRRDEQGHHYIQTNAPISPGSSGGGLFDARGNLIGVTTLVLVGREHLNQSLNFAIPIDAFYAP
ncbi:MAG TPA: trypsin-like peptidase domain-containing protein [Polyangiaceae bacterium]|nr:trypsin-like peptidase domain-containing protein [Polyangiaceae bacterium]